MKRDDSAVELLRSELEDLRAQVHNLTSIVSQLVAHSPPRKTHVDAASILATFRAVIGDLAFTSKELLAHADVPENEALREVLRSGIRGEITTKKVGKLLGRLEGRDIADLRVERRLGGKDHDGVVWRVLRL